ncbi:MAG: hypothetical protein A2096_00105 [Spirochaetes bacterium GWF1_41_5]|nr:MAG: hypothetical protein A2096_00105 [Spirochaetes bacterium GWF1_41_5]HBE04175.1 hypothetical protein [Spirochaetia bacterium]
MIKQASLLIENKFLYRYAFKKINTYCLFLFLPISIYCNGSFIRTSGTLTALRPDCNSYSFAEKLLFSFSNIQRQAMFVKPSCDKLMYNNANGFITDLTDITNAFRNMQISFALIDLQTAPIVGPGYLSLSENLTGKNYQTILSEQGKNQNISDGETPTSAFEQSVLPGLFSFSYPHKKLIKNQIIFSANNDSIFYDSFLSPVNRIKLVIGHTFSSSLTNSFHEFQYSHYGTSPYIISYTIASLDAEIEIDQNSPAGKYFENLYSIYKYNFIREKIPNILLIPSFSCDVIGSAILLRGLVFAIRGFPDRRRFLIGGIFLSAGVTFHIIGKSVNRSYERRVIKFNRKYKIQD